MTIAHPPAARQPSKRTMASWESVYLTVATPFIVVEATSAWLRMFGLDTAAIHGRTLDLLMGPGSAPARLHALLARVCECSSKHNSGDGVNGCNRSCACRGRYSTQMVLYTAQGDSALYLIRAKLSHRFCDRFAG